MLDNTIFYQGKRLVKLMFCLLLFVYFSISQILFSQEKLISENRVTILPDSIHQPKIFISGKWQLISYQGYNFPKAKQKILVNELDTSRGYTYTFDEKGNFVFELHSPYYNSYRVRLIKGYYYIYKDSIYLKVTSFEYKKGGKYKVNMCGAGGEFVLKEFTTENVLQADDKWRAVAFEIINNEFNIALFRYNTLIKVE